MAWRGASWRVVSALRYGTGSARRTSGFRLAVMLHNATLRSRSPLDDASRLAGSWFDRPFLLSTTPFGGWLGWFVIDPETASDHGTLFPGMLAKIRIDT